MSITIYYGVEIPANDFDHLIITTDDQDALPLEMDIWTTDDPIDFLPQELLQEGEPISVDDYDIIIFNPPPTQPARQANVIIGTKVTMITDEDPDPKSKMVEWSNFDLMDKSMLDDMFALICTDLQVPIQTPKFITCNTNYTIDSDDGSFSS